jgi:hypothetical protein
MLKIWLTWLQPSLGLLGTALVLSNPLHAYAAPKPVVRNITKAPTKVSQWSTIRVGGTRIDQELLGGMAATPDLAVRRLAANSMGTLGLPSIRVTPKAHQHNRDPLASFVSPGAEFPKLSAKATKLQSAKNSDVASALARAINPQAPVLATRLYIGKSHVRVVSKFLPTGKRVTTPVPSATAIGTPTPLSAMMAAKTAVEPYPVVRPELMQKLERNALATNIPATNTAPSALNPIATIPPVRPQAVVPKTFAPQAKAAPIQSLDPIAAIPSGLQRLLGNNLNGEPMVATTPVATNAGKANPMSALEQLMSPTMASVPASVSAASLQLATAQAYTNVPKFNIPGESLLTARQLKPANLFAIERKPQNFTPTVASSLKSNYVATLAPVPKQSWTAVNQQNSLGGLILGSQPLTSSLRMATLLPTDTSAATGLPARALVDFN